jgi:hypothetical protein
MQFIEVLTGVQLAPAKLCVRKSIFLNGNIASAVVAG